MALVLVPGKWEVDFVRPDDLNDPFSGDSYHKRRLSGWVPVSVDAYQMTSSLRHIAVVWKHDPSIAWDATFDVSAATLFNVTNGLAEQKYFPTIVAAHSHGIDRFSAVYRKGGPPAYIVFADNTESFDDLNAVYRYFNYTLRWVAMYGLASDKFVGVYRRNSKPTEVDWHAYVLPTWDILQTHLDGHWRSRTQPNRPAGSARVAHIAMQDVYYSILSEPRYTAIWQSDHIAHAVAPVSYANLPPLLLEAAAKGFFPYRLSIASILGTLFCTVILQPTDVPSARTLRLRRLAWFSATKRGPTLGDDTSASPAPRTPPRRGGRVRSDIGDPRPPGADTVSPGASGDASATPTPGSPELKAIDDYIIAFMKRRNFRAGSIAVAWNKKLVYTSAYTWAEPYYPTTTPLSAFPIASLSKLFTSIGIFSLISKGTVSLETYLRDVDPSSIPSTGPWSLVKVKHLLAHLARWKTKWPASNDEYRAAEYRAAQLSPPDPAPGTWPTNTKQTLIDYFVQLEPSIAAAPEATSSYYNINYLMLGHVIQQLDPTRSYRQWMRRNVWEKVGIPPADKRRVAIVYDDPLGELPMGVLLPNVVPSEETAPRVPRTAWKYDRYEAGPFKLNPRTTDAVGSWTLAPVDIVRLLAAFDSPTYSEERLMSAAVQSAMWAPSSDPAVAQGGLGLSNWPWVSMGGKLPGSIAFLLRELSQKISIAYAFNHEYVVNVWQTAECTRFPDTTKIATLVLAAKAAGRFDGQDLWSLAGITEPIT